MATPVPQKDDVEHWTVEQVAAWLQQVELSDCCDIFLRKGIDGHRFLQLSEEDLFHWSRDVAIKNRIQIVKLVSQIKNLQQHPSTTRQPTEVFQYLGSQPPKTSTDNGMDHAVKDFSTGNEERQEHTGRKTPSPPPVPPRFQNQSAKVTTSSSFPRTNNGQKYRSFETHYDYTLDDSEDSSFDEEETGEHPRQKIQPMKGDSQGEQGIDDLYLVPLQASPSGNHTDLVNRDLPTYPQRSNQLPPTLNNYSITPQHRGLPWEQYPVKKERFCYGSDTNDNGRSHTLSCDQIPTRPPPPLLPDTLTPSHKKPLHSQTLKANHSPIQGGSISHDLAKKGSSGGKGGSFLHWQQYVSNSLPRWHTDEESSEAHLTIPSLEKNDHVYEIVDVPKGSYGNTETPGPNMSDQQPPVRPPMPPPRNQNQGLDDKDLSSRQGPVSLSHGKRPPAPLPLHAQTQSGGHNGIQKPPPPPPPPPPAVPTQTYRSRQPKKPSSLPTETSVTTVSLGNGECIVLTPLYQMIMEKPYFQFVSRSKAKELVLQGGEGTFLIRPSTRTDKPFTLTLKHNDRSYNINIRQRRDGLFALGTEKLSERKFSSIDEIVFLHYKEPLTLDNGESTLLRYSPLKPNKSVYVTHVP